MKHPCVFGDTEVVEQTLSDGSKIYNVNITDGNGTVEILALDEARAIKCASEIRQAINAATGMWP